MSAKVDYNETNDKDVKKPKPRRLFSFDSTKSTSSPRPSRSSFFSDVLHGPRPMNRNVILNDQNKDGTKSSSGSSIVKERSGVADSISHSIANHSVSQDRALSRLEPVRQTSLETTLSSIHSDPTNTTPVPVSNLWDNLRQHVLVHQSRPSTPTQPISRPGTPKPSRLAKFGFKQVVEDARGVEGDTRKFGDEILRACTVARHGELQKSSREKEGSTTMVTNVAPIPGVRKLDYLRRPLSMASVSSSSANVSAASLRQLFQILVHYSENNGGLRISAHLPYESRLLSTLLCPFLMRTRYVITRLDEEQVTAVEAFELLSKSWSPVNENAFVDRCLWCTKAAASLLPHSTRTRILASLRKLLDHSTDDASIQLSAQGFQSLSSGLILLLAALHRTSIPHNPTREHHSIYLPDVSSSALTNPQKASHPDVHLLRDAINKLLSGSLGEVEKSTIEEDYGAEYSARDRRYSDAIRRSMFLEALLNCVENSPRTGEWILCNMVEEYWPVLSDPVFTNLYDTVCIRRLNTFCRLSRMFLQPSLESPPTESSHQSHRTASMSSALSSSTLDVLPTNSHLIPHIFSMVQTRVIPEAEALGVKTGIDNRVILDTRTRVARLLLDITLLKPEFENLTEDVFGGANSTDSQDELQHVDWAVQTLAGWYRAGSALPWRSVLEKALQQLIEEGWKTSLQVLLSLFKHIPDDIKKSFFSVIFPILNDQLVDDLPPYPCPELSAFLSSLSLSWPPLFYKPFFACAASDKEVIVVNHLCTIQVHAKYVSNYWTRDPEMLCIALLSDIGMTDLGSIDGKRGTARLGQLVLLVELIGKLQKLRHERDASGSDVKFHDVLRFVTTLESRLRNMIEVKERNLLLPASQRMLLCMLFREVRLLNRSLKQAPWLSTTLKWFDEFCADDFIGNLEQEAMESVQRIQGLYMAAQAGVQQIHERHTSMLAVSSVKAELMESIAVNRPLDLAATFVEHRKLIDSLSKGYIPRTLKLFVAVSPLISVEDYRRLGPTLWQHCLLDNADTSSNPSACFLLMHCAEKTTMDLLPAMEVDMHASDDTTRLEAIRKIGILINWRFQILSQNFLVDRMHRPFKLGRPPVPFLATDIGSSLYIPVEDINPNQDKGAVPLELKKRLAELGWVEEDALLVDPRQELIKTPLSILPIDQFDRLEVGDIQAAPISPLPTPQPSPRRTHAQQPLQPIDDGSNLLRRNSTSGGPAGGGKRRAVFVPPLCSIFSHLVNMVFDSKFSIASAARTTILDLMRSDPALLTRSVLDCLAGENKDIKFVVSIFSALAHIRQTLPPPLTHYVFNNLAGFLKFVAKHVQTPDALEDFGQVIRIVSSLAIQVSGMSMREIRRSKMEHFLIPSGSLWFSSPAPKSPMFPRNLEHSNVPFEADLTRLVSITMVRTCQNLFFLSMLKRNYKDVQAIRKSMSTLILPSLNEGGLSQNMELGDFVPHKEPLTAYTSRNGTVDMLSLMVCRSHILLVAQIFRSMPRHLSDRHELAVLIDGLNRSLLAHGNDINIVSQVLIALMVASTRFKRLFLTGRSYTLFMPALVKTYTEQSAHSGIRSAIEYAVDRFYALHKESFLYQSVHIIGQIAMLLEHDEDWFSKGIFDMFASLRKTTTASSIDMGGIYNSNRIEEREALLIHTADETPQTFLAAIRRGESQSSWQMKFELPEEYESVQLSMDDFVRLLLTVIAHDLTISRAQHFLRLLRLLSCHLYNSSASTRAVLAEGIAALGAIFTRAFSKPKGGELPKSIPEQEEDTVLNAAPGIESLGREKSRIPSDSKAMRMDFMHLVLAFGLAGGSVSPAVVQQTFDVTRSLLKDWAEGGFLVIADFLSKFVQMLLIREEPLAIKETVDFLHGLVPILHAFMMVDFTGVLETILKLLQVPIYSADVAFSQVVVDEICSAGLAACDLASSENQLMNLSYRPTLISLISNAIFLREVDIIGELEKRPPTHNFLSGVVLPLTLVMKTGAHIIGDSTRTNVHRRALTNAWLRLLFYAMAACQKSRRDLDDVSKISRGIGSLRSKSIDSQKRESALWKSHIPTLMIALQIIKVVVIRGADDISSVPRLGIWERLGIFLRTMLAEGDADFALKPETGHSTRTTPTGSPRSSAQLELPAANSGYNLFVSTSSSLNTTAQLFPSDDNAKFARPGFIDYCLWSMLEFVSSYRSPLRMQLKILAMEKVLGIEHELTQGARSSHPPYPSSPSDRRLSASISLRARQRASTRGVPSSPDSSPYLHHSRSNLSSSPSNASPVLRPLSPVQLGLSPSMLEIPSTSTRRPGYAVSPVTPYDRAPGWPKIVHLGPASPSATFPPVPSPSIGLGLRRYSHVGTTQVESTASQTRDAKLRSLPLAQETYRRIRGVQAFMGCSQLLPMPGSRSTVVIGDKDDAALPLWTKTQALTSIVDETNALLAELVDPSATSQDEASIIVEIEPSTPITP